MLEHTKILIELQNVDLQIDALTQKAQDIPRKIEQLKMEFSGKTKGLEELKQEWAKIQLAKKQKELDLSTKEEEIKKHQTELFKIKTNKEYTALQNEINRLKEVASMTEDEIIRILDAIEDMEHKIKNEQENVKNNEKSLQQDVSVYEAELKSLQQSISEHEKQKQEFAARLKTEILQLYERIRKSKKGLAIVEIKENSSCGGCNMTLPPQLVNEVRREEEIVVCENCSRILYWKGQ